MPTTKLPWPAPAEQHRHDGAGSCPLLAQMPAQLREAAEAAPHLFRYLHAIPVEEIGLPEYHAELSYELAKLSSMNVLYPVGDLVYVHICSDPDDTYGHYVSVEPGFGVDLEPLLQSIEDGLVGSIERLAQAASAEDLSKALNKGVDENRRTHDARSHRRASKTKEPRSKATAAIPNDELDAAKYLLVRDKVRHGVLEPLLSDPYIETIACSGLGRLFIEHRMFGPLQTALTFDFNEELDEFVLKVAEKARRPVTGRQPIADAILAEGARINIVFGSDVSKRGSNFTISKAPATPMSVLALASLGTLDYTMVAYLSLLVQEGMNLFICGEGGSGKTSLLNAITVFVPPSAKIVSIEDTPELRVPHTNWLREVVREGPSGKTGSDVSVFSLLKAALRQRPNVIVMGEIRGEEGNIAFQAMQTGHQVMGTMHASSVEKLIQRLTGNPICVPKAYVDNLNVALITGTVRLPGGKFGRRVLSVNEIVDYDPHADSFSFIEVFRWDGSKDAFEFVPQSYLMEQRIAFRRGFTLENRKAIYDELTRRTALFENLHDRASGFYELAEVLAKAYMEGLL